MAQRNSTERTRRSFLKTTGVAAAATTLAGGIVPRVHAAESNTLRVALVGCGGRGTGAAVNALSVKDQGPIKLVAMADVFPDRLKAAYAHLKQGMSASVDVPPERQYVGFDAYKQAMDCLGPGDVVIFASPPAFRWVHFGYAVEKGLNVFMEKPVTVDGPTTKRMLDLADESLRKNLKVGVGLMCRHCVARGELAKRIQGGEISDIIALRAYRMTPPVGFFASKKKPDGISELMYQVQRFHGFIWASGGAYSDFLIHNIDESCWMKNEWPVEAQASGGRHFRGDYVDQNFDNYSVEYTFADGSKLFLYGRNMVGCKQEFASYAQGSKNSAVISTAAHYPAKSRIYRGQRIGSKDDLLWRYERNEPNPYQLEWDNLIEAIRRDKPFNEARRGAEASLVTSMGRMAAHTGQVVTYDRMLHCDHEMAPDVDKLVIDGPAPLEPNDDGTYPIPLPGITTKREW